jgi:phenylalanyl-tRNA synthetase alpha chain
MKDLKNQIELFQQGFSAEISQALDNDTLEAIRIKYLGRHGHLTQMMTLLKNLSTEEKKEFGPILNQLKQNSEQLFLNKQKSLQDDLDKLKAIKRTNFDVTAYEPQKFKGSLHPTTLIIEKIEDIFISMGYEIIYGNEVETEFHNFDALNIPKDHPARESHDTFWLNLPGKLLRTHTSNVQIHTMMHKSPPLAMISHGRVFRNEATDSSHDFMFDQLEGLVVDKNISMAHLLGTIKNFLRATFGNPNIEIKIRPSYFPFVEPGIEIDMTCPFCPKGCSTCKKTGWIEMGGAGLIHPNVLKAVNIDPKEFSGFAFGFGLTRLVMLRYGISDIRLLHSNKIDFLQQFS